MLKNKMPQGENYSSVGRTEKNISIGYMKHKEPSSYNKNKKIRKLTAEEICQSQWEEAPNKWINGMCHADGEALLL